MNIKNLKHTINVQSGIIYLALFVMWIFLTFVTGGNFLSARNISNIARTFSTTGILASSTVLIIVAGGIDLSAGATAMLSGVLVAALMTKWGVGIIPSVLIVLAAAVFLGLFNGFIISRNDVAPFIITLATQMIYYGIAFMICQGQAISPLPKQFSVIGLGYLPNMWGTILTAAAAVLIFIILYHQRNQRIKYEFKVRSFNMMLLQWFIYALLIAGFVAVMNAYRGVPLPVLIMILVTIILSFISRNTTWGRSIYSIGGNREAAHYSGIKVERNWMLVYILQSVMACLAGMVLAAKVNSGSLQTGVNLHLDAIAAAVIGGTSMKGGVGRVIGAIVGALFMATIENGMSMMNVNISWQFIIKGIVLVSAVVFDAVYSKKNANK